MIKTLLHKFQFEIAVSFKNFNFLFLFSEKYAYATRYSARNNFRNVESYQKLLIREDFSI